MADMLTPTTHPRILADFDRITQVAGVQGMFLHKSMKDYCGDGEVDWVKKFRQYREDGIPGLLLHGVEAPDSKCQAITAALLRNYIDARVVPVNRLLDEKVAPPSPTVLVIPNLYVSALSSGKSLPSWRIQALYDLLLERSIQNKPTVAYVEDLKGVEALYGKPFGDFLGRFTVIN